MDYYCRDLHTSLSVKFYDDSYIVSPCCYSWDNKEFKMGTFDFTKLSTVTRADNALNKPLSNDCRVCKRYESNGLESKRQSGNTFCNNEKVFNLSGPEYLELNLDFTCNAACMICGPECSSLWKKYDDKVIPVRKITNNFDVLLEFFNNLDLSHLKKMHILGGEPFLSSRNEQILQYLVENVDASKVDIMYHTNASIFPSANVLELFNKFRLIEIYVSLDDVGHPYNYQRFPLKWEKIEDNIIEYQKNMPVNVMFNIEHTISVLNLHRIKEMNEWFESSIIKTNRLGDPSHLVRHYAFGKLEPRKVSKLHRNWLLEYYPESAGYLKTADGRDFEFSDTTPLVAYILDQDRRRNINIADYFPEFLSFYKCP